MPSAPIPAGGAAIGQPRDHDGRDRPHPAIRIVLVPDMAREVAPVGSAAQAVPVAERIDRRRAIGGADREAAERRLQRLEQFLAQLATRRDGEVGVVGMLGMPLKSAISLSRKSRMKNERDSRTPAELLKTAYRSRPAHRHLRQPGRDPALSATSSPPVTTASPTVCNRVGNSPTIGMPRTIAGDRHQGREQRGAPHAEDMDGAAERDQRDEAGQHALHQELRDQHGPGQRHDAPDADQGARSGGS